jgi:hypothetical protein
MRRNDGYCTTTMKKKKANKDKTFSFISPESSNVEGGTYSDGYVVLAFRDKKDTQAKAVYYYYENVLLEDWLALFSAGSKGKHMKDVFRKLYKGVKLE